MQVFKDSPFKGSLCESCHYYVRREIRPLEGDNGAWQEAIGIDIDDDTILETHACYALGIDLDHIVLSCNKWVDSETARFYSNVEKFKP